MNPSEYKLFSILAKERNMRKASERLFVSQPALSQRLQKIEEEWGARLFIRSNKGLTLTPAGEMVARLANEVLEKEERVKEMIQTLESEVYGTIKIACASIVGQHWLPQVLKQFVKKYPHAKISLETGWSSEILGSVYDHRVHIGIIRGTPEWNGVKHYLFKDYLYLVDKEIKKVEDVLQTERPFIQFKSDSNYDLEIQNWWYSHFQSVPGRVIMVDQIETCKQMALNGIGYAILPEISLHGLTDELNIIPLMDEKSKPIGRDTWLLGYPSAFELRQVSAFVDIVKEFLQNQREK